MQIARWPDLQSSSSLQPTGMYVAGSSPTSPCRPPTVLIVVPIWYLTVIVWLVGV